MRESEFDYTRWVVYGLVLVALALVSFFSPLALWIFAIVLVIAVIDIVYTKYFKGKVWSS